MGVLNRTPDSFSDGGMFMDDSAAVERVKKMVRDGADIIDVGGESTRPGSEPVGLDEELSRTIPFIERLSREVGVPVSIDTTKPEVARRAIDAGASIVNDVSGLKADEEMAGVVSKSGVKVCVMSQEGEMNGILKSLRESVEIAEKAGVSPDKIIVDPGIGFGKTAEQNLTVIKQLSELKALGKPILIGVSRKSFIGKALSRDVEERLMGTAAASAVAVMNGADIIRAHDTEEMRDVAMMADAIKREEI
jgi:dihydropteroate synthase